MEEKLKHKISFGLFILITREALVKVIAIVGQVLLFRLFDPSIFGKLAILSFVIGVTEIFTDSGLSAAIIREQGKLSDQVLSSIFYCKVVLTAAALVVLWGVSNFIGGWFNGLNPTDIRLLLILSLTLFSKPLRGVLLALLEKELKYEVLPIIDLSGLVIYYLVAVWGAFQGWGIGIFILAALVKEAVELVMCFYFAPWLPSWHFSWEDVKNKLHFGLYLQFSVILSVLHQSVVPLIGGVQTNPTSVGLLDWSKNVASLPKSVMENVGRISFSSFSQIQENKQAVTKAILFSMQLLTMLAIFCFIFAWGFAKDVVNIILTPLWLPALPALEWMLVSLFFVGAVTSLNQGLVVIGKTKELFFTSVVSIGIELLVAWFLTLRFGFIGIAMASCVGWFLLTMSAIYLGVQNGLELRIQPLLYKNCIFFVLLFPLTYLLKNTEGNTLMVVLLKMVTVGSVGAGLLFFLAHKEVLLFIKPLLSKKTHTFFSAFFPFEA